MELTNAINTFIEEKCLYLQEQKVETNNEIELLKEETKIVIEKIQELETRIKDKYEVIDFLRTNLDNGKLNEFREHIINTINAYQEEIVNTKNIVAGLKEKIKENVRQIEKDNVILEGLQNMHELFAGFKEHENDADKLLVLDLNGNYKTEILTDLGINQKKRGRPKTNDTQIS